MEAISVKNLSVAYENNTIIEDLSLSIPKGKISIIIGANGCGKSTFLKTLARINKPKAGERKWHFFLKGQYAQVDLQ